MRVTFARRLIIVLVIALLAAVGQHWYLWRFVFVEPSVLRDVSKSARVKALTVFEYNSGHWLRLPLRGVIPDAETACAARPKACMDYGVVTTAIHLARTSDIPEVPEDVLAKAWRALEEAEPVKPIDDTYVASSRTGRGVVMQFSDGGHEQLIIGRHSAQLANDRYSYSEASIVEGELTPRRHVSFRFDVAGVEFLTMPVLIMLNLGAAIILLVGWTCVESLRRRLRLRELAPGVRA